MPAVALEAYDACSAAVPAACGGAPPVLFANNITPPASCLGARGALYIVSKRTHAPPPLAAESMPPRALHPNAGLVGASSGPSRCPSSSSTTTLRWSVPSGSTGGAVPCHARGTGKSRGRAATASRRRHRSGTSSRTGEEPCATRAGYATGRIGWCLCTGGRRLLASSPGSTLIAMEGLCRSGSRTEQLGHEALTIIREQMNEQSMEADGSTSQQQARFNCDSRQLHY
jgi:hypothetical protein